MEFLFPFSCIGFCCRHQRWRQRSQPTRRRHCRRGCRPRPRQAYEIRATKSRGALLSNAYASNMRFHAIRTLILYINKESCHIVTHRGSTYFGLESWKGSDNVAFISTHDMPTRERKEARCVVLLFEEMGMLTLIAQSFTRLYFCAHSGRKGQSAPCQAAKVRFQCIYLFSVCSLI